MPNWGTEVIPEGFSFDNFKLTFFGKDIIQLDSFEFDEKADFSMIIGKGGLPVSYIKKKTEWDAKASIQQAEFNELIRIAQPWGGNVTQLPIAPLVASCINPLGTWQLTIPAVKIKSVKESFKQGDDKTLVPIDFIVLGFPRREIV